MPFTPAHAAAIVPLRSRFTVTSALVIGSMAPDYEYFVRARLLSTFSHTFLGVFAFCLPLGIAVFLVVRSLRGGFILLMPQFIRERMPLGSWDHPWSAIALSVTVGAFTHVIWDSFTHRDGWSAQRFGLGETVFPNLPGYSVLQHLSTVVGLVVITAVVVRFLSRQNRVPQNTDHLGVLRVTFWIFAIVAPSAALVVFISMGVGLGTSAVRAIDALVLVAAVFSLIAVSRATSRPAV